MNVVDQSNFMVQYFFLLYAINDQIVLFVLLYCILSVLMHRTQLVIKIQILHQAKNIESHRKIIIYTNNNIWCIIIILHLSFLVIHASD